MKENPTRGWDREDDKVRGRRLDRGWDMGRTRGRGE
jgi:hypothetical protein